MSSRWRDTVTALAGRAGRLPEGPDPEWDGIVFRLDMPGAMFRRSGVDPEEAWRSVAHELGHVRVIQALENSDPDGRRRVHRRGVVRGGAGSGRARLGIEWVAYVEPLETRTWESLRSAIARRGRPIHVLARSF